MPRIRELGIYDGRLAPGPLNAITDVSGVKVGHYTLIEGEGPCTPGKGPFRTGVTVILPHGGNLYANKVPAAVHTINGFGKVAGFEQVRELGQIETPVALTGTLNVPRVADALISLAIEQNPHIGIGFEESGRKGYVSVNPLVGETSDGYLSDIQARPIGVAEVRAAISSASGRMVEEGVVGAGTGTRCYGWKGGIGTASRSFAEDAGGFVLGVLVQTNFGLPAELTIAGVPVGHYLRPTNGSPDPIGGSIMIILGTDAPLDSRQLKRLCHRAAFGLARTGSTCRPFSGDFVIAFSTANPIAERPGRLIDSRLLISDEQRIITNLGLATVECVEEAIYNSLLMARLIVGRDGNTAHALPAEEVRRIVVKHRRLAGG